MDVEITYTRTTTGRATVPIDEDEVRAWLTEADPLFDGVFTNSDVLRFLKAGEDEAWESYIVDRGCLDIDDEDIELTQVVL